MSHTTYEVTVGCGYTALTLCEYTHISAKARSAGWCADDCAGFDKCADQSLFHCIQINLLGSRDYDNTKSLGNLLALQNLSGNTKIIHTTIRAGTDHYLIDLHISDLIDRLRILREMWKCDGWL